MVPPVSTLFEKLYTHSLTGDFDCGGLLPYGYYSGESITFINEGRPLFVRTPDSRFTLANFMRANLYTSLGAVKLGMDILLKDEDVPLERITGHGGLFKTPGVMQKYLAAAVNTPVTVMSTASEGGAWGIAPSGQAHVFFRMICPRHNDLCRDVAMDRIAPARIWQDALAGSIEFHPHVEYT